MSYEKSPARFIEQDFFSSISNGIKIRKLHKGQEQPRDSWVHAKKKHQKERVTKSSTKRHSSLKH